MKRASTIVLAGTVVIALSGCSSGGSADNSTTGGQPSASGGGTTGGAAKKYTIAVIPKGSTHEYWKSVHEGANKAATELGDVTIDWKGPQKEDDKSEQVDIVQDFAGQGVNGIVLAPLDDKALSQPVMDAAKQNIPVVVIDSGLQGTGYISYIATDNEKGGEMAGDYLSKILGGKGRVVMLRYEEGSASTDAREKGFLEAIKKSPGITVVSENQYGGVTADTAMKASENLLTSFKKGNGLDIDGIYTPNESTTFGMLRTLTEDQLAGKVKFVGFDASDKLIEGLTSGAINGLIIQNPRKMGYLGVKAIEQYLKGNKNVDKTVDTGATLVTKDNMGSDEIKQLIAPPNV